MAHFAQVDASGIVVRVVVADNEHEDRGAEYLSHDLGLGGAWVQTSYSGAFRGKLAGIGDTYDAENDVFVAPIDEDATEEDPEP